VEQVLAASLRLQVTFGMPFSRPLSKVSETRAAVFRRCSAEPQERRHADRDGTGPTMSHDPAPSARRASPATAQGVFAREPLSQDRPARGIAPGTVLGGTHRSHG